MPILSQYGFDLFFLVERGVVKDDNAGLVEQGQQLVLKPLIDARRLACSLERLRRKPSAVSLRHDEVRTLFALARHVREDFLSA